MRRLLKNHQKTIFLQRLYKLSAILPVVHLNKKFSFFHTNFKFGIIDYMTSQGWLHDKEIFILFPNEVDTSSLYTSTISVTAMVVG